MDTDSFILDVILMESAAFVSGMQKSRIKSTRIISRKGIHMGKIYPCCGFPFLVSRGLYYARLTHQELRQNVDREKGKKCITEIQGIRGVVILSFSPAPCRSC